MNHVGALLEADPVMQAVHAWVEHGITIPDWAMAEAERDPSTLYWLARRIGYWASTTTTRYAGPLGPLTAQRERMERADRLARHLCMAMDVALRRQE